MTGHFHIVLQIHTNPCFFKLHGAGPQSILQKDQPKILEHGDVVALLPDKLSYRIEYADAENKYELYYCFSLLYS